MFKFFRFQLFLIQGTDEHQVSQLFDHSQRVRDATRPDIRPNLIHFVFDDACYHLNFLPVTVSSTIFFLYYNMNFSLLQPNISNIERRYRS